MKRVPLTENKYFPFHMYTFMKRTLSNFNRTHISWDQNNSSLLPHCIHTDLQGVNINLFNGHEL